jgi:hypothetical protein
MLAICKTPQWIGLLAMTALLLAASNSRGQNQQRRFEPARPTVSPYLNLFRFNDSVVPNYQSLVRPQQQAQRFKQQQLDVDNQRLQEIRQLQSNVRVLQQPRVNTELVAPTGKGSWFNVPSGSQFLNTSRFYSQSNGVDTPAAGAPRR